MGNILLYCSKCGNEFWMDEFEAVENKGDFICLPCLAAHVSNEPRERFEYMVESLGVESGKIVDRLNERGADGWELVNVSPAGTLIFKRRYVE